MQFFERIDFVQGELPPWILNLVALARPLATTMTVAIAPMGAATVGVVAYFDEETAMSMTRASVAFLQGIPEAGWAAIVAIALGYTAAKTAEVFKTNRRRTDTPAAPPPADAGDIPEYAR